MMRASAGAEAWCECSSRSLRRPRGAAAPVVAAHAAAGVAAGLDFLLLGRIARPAGRQLGGLHFLAAAGRRTGRGTRARRGRGLVQRALLGVGRGRGLRSRLRLLGLLGDQHLLGRSHHGADRLGFGQGLAAAFVQVGGTRGFLGRAGLGFGFGLGAGLGLRGIAGSGLGSGLARCFLAHGGLLGLLLGLLGGVGGCALFGFALAALTLLAFSARCAQLFLLPADEVGLAAGLFLAACEILVLGGRRDGVLGHGALALGGALGRVVALDEGALLAHFHLDRARLARGIGLLDLAGGLLGQRDLLAVGRGGAVAGLQESEQLLLVRFGQGIGRGSLGHASGLELVEQGFRRFLEFAGELGDSVTGHIRFVPPLTLTLAPRTSVRAPS